MQRSASRRDLAYVGQLAALTAVYVVAGRLGLAFSPVSGFATLVWPPTGACLAALLLGGCRLWPAVAVGAFATNVWTGATPLVACGIAAGNTLEAVVGALALRRIPGFRGSFDRFAEVIGLAVVGAGATAISATVGVASLASGGVVPAAELAWTWIAWWTGDLIGVLVVTPLVLTWALRAPGSDRRAEHAEAAAVGAFVVTAAVLVCFRSPETVARVPIFQPYVLFLPSLWAALRFGPRGAATGTFVLAVFATWGTYSGHGAFVRAHRAESLAALHVFLAALALGSLVLGSVVAAQKQAEEERAALFARERDARVEAQAATRAKDDFLAVLSHELRTPLQSMLGWTQMLRPRLHDADTVARGLAAIERNARAQAQLIEDLLDVSRIVAGKLRLARERTNLADVVEAALGSARSLCEARSIRLEATIDPTVFVFGDLDRLQQVVANLLTNAVKFTPEGGWIGVRLERERTAARIVVEDSGRGVSPELLPYVFDRFRQAESGTTRRQGGLGLGLAIVRHLVEMHGGTVKAESPGEGRGATFTVTLPVVSARRVAVAGGCGEESRAGRSVVLQGLRVLVVDDDPDACELLERVLHEAGAEVRAVRSARAALDDLPAFCPDVLLSDIGMPEEDGYALIRKLRARESGDGAHIPAVAITAFASPADREQAFALGFEAHLAKPVSPGDLTRAVAHLMGRAT